MLDYRSITEEQLANALRALAHPQRLAIYARLVECCGPGSAECAGEDEVARCVGVLGQDLGIAPSTVSHHVRELRMAGLIEIQRRGRFVECQVSRAVLSGIAGWFAEAARLADSAGQEPIPCRGEAR